MKSCNTCKHVKIYPDASVTDACYSCNSYSNWEDDEEVYGGVTIKPTDEHDPVNKPVHYTPGKYECIEIMEDIFGIDSVKDFCLLNAFKYLWRHKYKSGLEDLEKAWWYLDHYISISKEGKDGSK